MFALPSVWARSGDALASSTKSNHPTVRLISKSSTLSMPPNGAGRDLAAASRSLFQTEREQHIARPATVRAVSRVHVDHSADDRRRRTDHRRAPCGHAIHGVE